MNESKLSLQNLIGGTESEESEEELNAAIYARTSSSSQQFGYSIDGQVRKCWRRCQQMDWTVTHVYCDEDINEQEMFVVHGSPREKLNEYVWEENVDQGTLDFWFSSSPDFVILGHTHRPFVKSVGETTILNPGSVGQPRDGDPKSSFAVIDLEAHNVNRYRVGYEIDEVARKTLEYLPRKLADRLYEGR